MKEGTIIEQGSHKELIEKKGFYEELYNSQFTSEYDEDVVWLSSFRQLNDW